MAVRSSVLIAFAVAVLCASLSVSLSSQAPSSAPAAAPQAAAQPATADRTYVGSQTCRRCHADTYERWSKTRMANVVTDPRVRPDVIIPDLSKPDPLLTFKLDDIAFVYGSKWKQRYFTKVGDDYFPLPAQWDVTNGLAPVLRAAEHRLVGAALSRRTTCSGRPARSATAATRSTTTSRPRR